VSLILGTAFIDEHVQSLLPRERLMVLSSDVSIPLVTILAVLLPLSSWLRRILSLQRQRRLF
jgi:hypothetical protein